MQFGMSFRCKILKLVVARQSHYIHAKLYSNLTNQTPGIVYVSTSTDVFTNLAWEQWWYENGNFTSHRALLIYCNDPCVVVGRHQNPWVECDVKEAAVSSLPLSRRQSGGGTVYHDLGNINCSFMTSRKHYNRRENLDFLADLISTRWDLDVSVNIRDDLILDNFYKVSGSAAKLGKDTAYHHCTLLVNSGLTALHSILRPDRLGWSSNATASVPSPVATLASAAVDINTELVIEAIAEAYLSAYENSVTLVTPSDSVCPGWSKIRQELSSWEWIYGRTPKFTIHKALILPGIASTVTLELNVVKGRIAGIQISNEELTNLSEILLAELYSCRLAEKDIVGRLENVICRPDTCPSDSLKILCTHISDIV